MPLDTTNSLIDMGAGAGLLLFTGAEAAFSAESTIDIIAKFGVIGVLWYWLQDMKKRMREQLDVFKEQSDSLTKAFDEEVDEIRAHYKEVIEALNAEHKEYKTRLDAILAEQRLDLKELREKIFNLIESSRGE